MRKLGAAARALIFYHMLALPGESRACVARELAARFGCSVSTVYRVARAPRLVYTRTRTRRGPGDAWKVVTEWRRAED